MASRSGSDAVDEKSDSTLGCTELANMVWGDSGLDRRAEAARAREKGLSALAFFLVQIAPYLFSF